MFNPFLSNSFFFLYHLVFIFIFLATAIVSLGSILNLPWFSGIQEHHKKILLYVILVQVAGAVLITYQSIPIFASQTQEYDLLFYYKDYDNDWLASSDPTERQCLIQYQQNPTQEISKNCKNYVELYQRQKTVFGKTGKGTFYYKCDLERPKCKGIAVYLFPLRNSQSKLPTIIEIRGKQLSQKRKEVITLDFIQLPSAADINGKLFKREEYRYPIDFTYDKKNFNFTGTLKTERNGKDIEVATVVIS